MFSIFLLFSVVVFILLLLLTLVKLVYTISLYFFNFQIFPGLETLLIFKVYHDVWEAYTATPHVVVNLENKQGGLPGLDKSGN